MAQGTEKAHAYAIKLNKKFKLKNKNEKH